MSSQKEKLLDALNEALYAEEELISLYSKFLKKTLEKNEDLSPQIKEKIKKIVFILYQDSLWHKKAISNILKEIKYG